MVIEYARDVLGIADAGSTEFDPDCPNPVIATMEEQKDIVAGNGDMGHTMRLGSYPPAAAPSSVSQRSAATHLTLTLAQLANPPALMASVTER